MTRPLLRSAAFVRASRRVVKRQPQVLDAIGGTLRRLESDAFDPRLRTHKLKGDLAGCWACSAGYDLRIVFEFVQHRVPKPSCCCRSERTTKSIDDATPTTGR